MLRLLALATILSLVLLPQTPSAAGARAPTAFTAAMNNARPWLMLTPILLSLRLSWPAKLIGTLCLAFLAGLSAAEPPLAIILFEVLFWSAWRGSTLHNQPVDH